VDRDVWAKEYRRLLTAYGKSTNAEQAAAYYSALQSYPGMVVEAAVTSAIREAKTWPSAADLVERARLDLRTRQAPASICDVCRGERYQVWHCAGVSAPDAQTTPLPVDRSQYCGRDWVHADHAWATCCPQCHPASQRREA
jgi:hypothetical protein